MMINKRLINLCEDSKKYIIFTVLSSWIAILCNILIVFIIGNFINKIYSGITQLNILKHLNELIII